MTPIILTMFAQSTRAPKESAVVRDEKTQAALTKVERVLADYQRGQTKDVAINRMKAMSHIVDLLSGVGLDVGELSANQQFYTDWVEAVTIAYGHQETGERANDVVSHMAGALQFAGNESSVMTTMIAGRMQQAADKLANGFAFAAQGLIKELCAVRSDDLATLYAALGMVHADTTTVLALGQYLNAEFAVATALEPETEESE